MKIAIMGFGVVGSGVGEIIMKNQQEIAKKCGEPVEISHILDLRDFPSSPFDCFTKDFNDILADGGVGLVVETMGGCNPAYRFTKELLLAGKHVITSNKELVAEHGTELLNIAKEKNVNYMFEASVGGGIPIIRPIYACLTAGKIKSIMGILNGTTNYILTQMFKNGESFENALRAAQEKGYAESDPTADVEGMDTCRKIAILSSLASGKGIDSNKIETEGITEITAKDVDYAEKLGYAIKLIGHSMALEDGRIYAAVFPAFVPVSSPLAGISDVFNGILVNGDDLGDVMFYGRGAGKLPTANAVVSDVIDAIRHKAVNVELGWREHEPAFQSGGESVKYSYYVRVSGASASAVKAEKVLSLDDENELALITEPYTPAELEAFLASGIPSGAAVLGKMRLVG